MFSVLEHPPAQPGSIDSERGIFAMTYDHSGTRLITAEADKSIKMWKEDEEAVSSLLISADNTIDLDRRDSSSALATGDPQEAAILRGSGLLQLLSGMDE